MSDIKQSPVLEFISEKIKKAIADAKLEQQSAVVSIIKDGNDVIHIEQSAETPGNTSSIFITDKREILYSEDLLEELQDLHLDTESHTSLHGELKATTVIVNGLTIETEFVFQAVKDCFDTLSSSYQYIKIVQKNVNSLTIDFNFGDHRFRVVVTNEPESIHMTTQVVSSASDKVKKTIEDDVVKVQQALNKLFKAN